MRSYWVCMCMSVCDAYTEYRKHCPVSESSILEKKLVRFATIGSKRKVAKVCYREKLISF